MADKKLSPLLQDAYEANARCLDRMGMAGAANRYWNALDQQKVITPNLPPSGAVVSVSNGEAIRRRITAMLSEKPMTIPEMAVVLELSFSGVAHHTSVMKRDGKIKFMRYAGKHPKWGVVGVDYEVSA